MIIFGCGYVGRSLAIAAVDHGYEVWIHSRNPASLAEVDCVPPERRIVAELQSPDWHSSLTGSWDVAVNLVSSAGGGLDGYRTSYIEGNHSILNWADSVSVERFIYTSATSVYPQTDGSWVSEEDVPGLHELSPSGQLLREAENVVLDNGAISKTIILRLAGIYGPGRHLYLNMLRAGESVLPGNGSAWLNLIYLKDIISAIMLLTEIEGLDKREIFNLVDNIPAQKQEIVDWLASELEVASMRFDPAIRGDRFSRRGVAGVVPNRRVSNSLIKEKTGWKPAFTNYRLGYQEILA